MNGRNGKMKKNKLSAGVFILIGLLTMGAFFNKTEANLGVIKAGVDEKGNPVCINKTQIYLFKKNQAENKIIFFYHDAQSDDAFVVKSFSDKESTDNYWEQLLKSW
mgnify:FL=1